jgi:hypothetical protein
MGLTVGLTVGSIVDSMMGSMVRLTVGLMVGLTWLCWAIDHSKAFDSSDERLNKLVILQTHFTGFIKQTRHFTGSLTAIIIVRKPYRR